jgi:hypothetical protein
MTTRRLQDGGSVTALDAVMTLEPYTGPGLTTETVTRWEDTTVDHMVDSIVGADPTLDGVAFDVIGKSVDYNDTQLVVGFDVEVGATIEEVEQRGVSDLVLNAWDTPEQEDTYVSQLQATEDPQFETIDKIGVSVKGVYTKQIDTEMPSTAPSSYPSSKPSEADDGSESDDESSATKIHRASWILLGVLGLNQVLL